MCELPRVLGRFDATCIVIGAIVGVGIFFTPSQVARIAGSGNLAMLTWLIGGGIALLGALACAELGGMYRGTAAHYSILRDSYGSLPSFVFATTTALVTVPGSLAIIALICAHNLVIAVTGHELPDDAVLRSPHLAALLILALTAANGCGVRFGAGIQNLTVVAKIGALVLVAILAAGMGGEAIGGPVVPPSDGPGRSVVVVVFAALVPAFFAYGGWVQLLWMSGEVRDAERIVPRAITFGVVIVVLIYLLTNWAFLRLLGPTGTASSGAVAADAVGVAWPALGKQVAAGAVAVSAFGVLNTGLLTCPRLMQGMAARGQFLAVFARIAPRSRTPLTAIILIGVMSLVLLLAASFDQRPVELLTTGVVFIDALFAALTGAAVLVLRHRAPDLPRPVRVPLYPWVPILFVLGEIGIVCGAYADATTRRASVVGLIWLAFAAAWWALHFRHKHAP